MVYGALKTACRRSLARPPLIILREVGYGRVVTTGHEFSSCALIVSSCALIVVLCRLMRQVLLMEKDINPEELDFLLRYPAVPGLVSPVDFLSHLSWGGIKASASAIIILLQLIFLFDERTTFLCRSILTTVTVLFLKCNGDLSIIDDVLCGLYLFRV